jgi:hypothetical protein
MDIGSLKDKTYMNCCRDSMHFDRKNSMAQVFFCYGKPISKMFCRIHFYCKMILVGIKSCRWILAKNIQDVRWSEYPMSVMQIPNAYVHLKASHYECLSCRKQVPNDFEIMKN